MSKIILAVGPMFSGKSAWLIQELAAYGATGKPFLAVRFSGDNRYSADAIASHDGTKYVAKNAKTVADIKNLLSKHGQITMLAVDEVQFFDPTLADLFGDLKTQNIKIFVTGLDTDFLAKPWETTQAVQKIADDVISLKAICSVCLQPNATRTQRLIGGKPAPKNSPRILIGDTETYTARCEEH